MKTQIINLYDGVSKAEFISWLVTCDDNTDFEKAWESVINFAEEKEYEGPISQIPKQWFESAGLHIQEIENIYFMTDVNMHPTRPYESAGLYPVDCSDCPKCYNGVCCKHRSSVDSTTDISACIQRADIYQLLHKNKVIATFMTDTNVDIHTFTPVEVLKLLKSPEFPNIPDEYDESDLTIRYTIE